MITCKTLWLPFLSCLKAQYSDSFQLKIDLCVMCTFALHSAACSSGQEASSIAVANLNFKKHQSNSFCAGVKIMGTNISE
jgi:chemotaxis methyl-accepting protein methylase